MNVYDFDKTIFYPDSSICFVSFCLKRYPRAFIQNAAEIAKAFYGYYVSGEEPDRLKESLFSFMSFLPDPDEAVDLFWKENFDRIGEWYLERRKDDDVIISASPEFLVGPAAEKLGVRLIATRMDKYSGKILNSNCRGREKVLRFRKEFGYAVIDEFYSDSHSDDPMAAISKKAFLVKGKKITEWV